MSDPQEYDVIIIGAGAAGGIPAAAYLQKAGANVLLVEANDAPAIHCRSYEFQGAICTPCAGGFAGGSAPMWADLELEKFGAELLINPRFFGMVFPDDTSLFLGAFDPQGTVKEIAQYSEKDAQTFAGMMERIGEAFIELGELIYYTPPSGENLAKIYERFAWVADMPVKDFSRMDTWEFLDYKFEDHRLKQALLMPLTSSMVQADPNKKGEGAVGILAAFFLVPGQLKGSNQKLSDCTMDVFKHFGGTLWLDSPVASIVAEDGLAVGVKMSDDSREHPGQLIRAKHAVLSNAGAIQSYKLLGDDTIRRADDALATKMQYWDNHSRPSTVTVWLLKEPPKWRAAEHNPYMNMADWLYVGLDSSRDWRTWQNALLSNEQENAFQGWWEIFMPGLIDPGLRGGEGKLTFRVESVVPYHLLNEDGTFDAGQWETYKHELVRQREEVFERMAPGFKESIIDVVIAKSPKDIWDDNRTAAFGCAQGGAFTGDQSYLGRLPYRMPIKNLYMCNSVWPASLTWCGTGYIAAGIIAEDMGIRDQDWWTSRPGEWFMENKERLIPTGAAWKYMTALEE